MGGDFSYRCTSNDNKKLCLSFEDLVVKCIKDDMGVPRLGVAGVPHLAVCDVPHMTISLAPNVDTKGAAAALTKQGLACTISKQHTLAVQICDNEATIEQTCHQSLGPQAITAVQVSKPVATQVCGSTAIELGSVPRPFCHRDGEPGAVGTFRSSDHRSWYIPFTLGPGSHMPFYNINNSVAMVTLHYPVSDFLWARKVSLSTHIHDPIAGIDFHDTNSVACKLGTVLLALGNTISDTRACLQGLGVNITWTMRICKTDLGVHTAGAAQAHLVGSGEWTQWVQRALPMPHVEANKSNLLLSLVCHLVARIGGAPDDGNDPSFQRVITPGQIYSQLLRECARAFRRVVCGNKLMLLHRAGANTPATWASCLWLSRAAFDAVGQRFLLTGQVGNTTESALPVPHDLNTLGRMATLTSLVRKASTTARGLEGDEVRRRGVQLSQTGFVCIVHINSTGGREIGGRMAHLTLGARVSVDACLVALPEGCRALDTLPGRRLLVLGEVPGTVLATLPLPTAPIDTILSWLGVDSILPVDSTVHLDLEWDRTQCATLVGPLAPQDLVARVCTGPGRLLQAQVLTWVAADGRTKTLRCFVDSTMRRTCCLHGVNFQDANPPTQAFGVVASAEPWISHAKGTKAVMTASHRTRALPVLSGGYPLVATRYAHESGLAQFRTGATAMVAVLTMTGQHANEEDALVVSSTAATNLLTYAAPPLSVHCRLPLAAACAAGTHTRFQSPRDPRLVAHLLSALAPATGLPQVGVTLTSPTQYVVGRQKMQADPAGGQVWVDCSLRWCDLVDTSECHQSCVLAARLSCTVAGVVHEFLDPSTTTEELELHMTLQTVCGQRQEHHIRIARGVVLAFPDITQVLTKHLVVVPNRGVHALDQASGLPPIGAVVHNGDYLCGIVRQEGSRLQTCVDVSVMFKAPDRSRDWVVTRIEGPTAEMVTIVLETGARQFREGDKLAFRHGQKGVGIVVPVAEMPYFPSEDGLVPDILINPAAVSGRSTIASLMEQLVGQVCVRQGVRALVDPHATSYALYDPSTNVATSTVTLKEIMEEHAAHIGHEPIVCGRDGVELGVGMCGPMVVHRLRQAGEVSAHDCTKLGTAKSHDAYTHQARQKHSLRIGSQESDCFNACGAAHLLQSLKAADTRHVECCGSCGALAQPQHKECMVCGSTTEPHKRLRSHLSHPLLTLRHNLALGRVSWTPCTTTQPLMSSTGPTVPSNIDRGGQSGHPTDLATALERFAAVVGE